MVTYTKLADFQLNRLLSTAEIYLALGYSVIPARQKIAAVSWKDYQTRRPSLNQLRQWFTDDTHSSLAIITGRISNLAVLDFDDPKQFRAFTAQYPYLAQTRTVQTRRGYHLYYHSQPQIRIASRSVPGVDLQFNGKYVIAPPSIINGHEYKPVREGVTRNINQAETDTINRFLDSQQVSAIEILKNPSNATTPERSGGGSQLVPDDLITLYRYAAVQKGRNNALFQLSLLGRDNGLSQDQVTQALADIHARQKTAGERYQQRRREAINTIGSAFSRKPRKRLHQYKEPTQLPNTVREALFQRKLTHVVRVIEALRLSGVRTGQGVIKQKAITLLKGIVGRDSIYNAFNTILDDDQFVFDPSPRTPQPPAYGIANPTGQSPNLYCIKLNLPKSGINRKQGRPDALFLMPSNLELAEKLGVRRSAISDELTLEDLKSAKSTREACHAGLIQRKPSQYTVKFFARRVGMSERTIYRYNADNKNIHSKPMFHDQPVFWNNLEAIIPAEIEYFPHEGVFLTDSKGQKYPPKRQIARRLLSKKQFVTLRTRIANYWWYGDVHMPLRFQADMNAIMDEMAEKTARSNRTYTPKYEFPVITPVAAKEIPKIPTQAPIERDTAGEKTSYRKPLPVDEDFARYTYRKINEMGGEGQISLESARRLVTKYGEKAVRQAMNVATSRHNITKPVGFISTYLRSDARGG